MQNTLRHYVGVAPKVELYVAGGRHRQCASVQPRLGI
jgi:hypothetical protein